MISILSITSSEVSLSLTLVGFGGDDAFSLVQREKSDLICCGVT